MKQNLAFSTGIVIFLSVFSAGIGYALRLYLARKLSVEEYGLFFSILVFVGLFVVFRDPGLNTSLAKFIPEFLVKKQEDRIKSAIISAFLVQIALASAITVSLLVFADKIAMAYFETPSAALPLRLIAVSFLVSTVMTLLQSVFQGFERMFYYAIVEPLRLSVIFFPLILVSDVSVASVSFYYAVAPLVVIAFLFLSLVRTFDIFGARAEITVKTTKQLLGFGFPLFLGSMGIALVNNADTLILTLFRGLKEVGLYQAALPTSQLLWFFISGITAVLLPAVSKLWARNEKGTVSRGISTTIKAVFLIMVPVAMMLVSFSEPILRLLFGEAYVPASQSLQILSVGSVFYSIYFLLSIVLLAIGFSKTYAKIVVAVAVLNTALNILLVPLLGISGAAVAVTFSYMVGAVVTSLSAGKLVEIRISFTDMLKVLSGALLVLAVVFSVKFYLSVLPLLAQIPVSLAVGTAFYFVFFVFFRVINKSDLENLSDIGIKIPAAAGMLLAKIVKS